VDVENPIGLVLSAVLVLTCIVGLVATVLLWRDRPRH
jgi:hypothetical protein